MTGLRDALEELLAYCREQGEKPSMLGPWDIYGDLANRVQAILDNLLAAGVFREPQPECGATDRTGQRRCVFTPGHHEVENWTSHGDRTGWTWNDPPADGTKS